MVADKLIRTAKIILLHDDLVLTFLRDDLPGLPWAGMWDFPGGVREAGETVEECVVRETFEEFCIQIDPASFSWSRLYPWKDGSGWYAKLFAATLEERLIPAIQLGNEGQEWRLMPVTEFLKHEKATPHYKESLHEYLSECHPEMIQTASI